MSAGQDQTSVPPPTSKQRRNWLALAALALAVLVLGVSLAAFLVGRQMDRYSPVRPPDPRAYAWLLFAHWCAWIGGGVAGLLGLAGLARAWLSGGRIAGWRSAALAVAVGLAAVSLPWVAHPNLSWPRGRRPCWGALWGLGRAAEMYANDHDGEPPPDAGTLVGTYFDGRIKPSHFIYVNGLRPYDRGDCVRAFCRPGSHGPGGGSVLFLDGHVEQVAEPRLKELLDRTRETAKYHGRTVELVEVGPAAE